jgi:predicted nucleic acid-binding protein
VSRVIVLDSGPLGALCNTRGTAVTLACNEWLERAVAAGHRIAIPEVVDYEVRREMLRLGRKKNLTRLDRMEIQFEYWPLTTAAMRQAAEFWAQARRRGQPTASDSSLDADVILAAQVVVSSERDFVVATSNVTHIARFVTAELWQNITP